MLSCGYGIGAVLLYASNDLPAYREYGYDGGRRNRAASSCRPPRKIEENG